MHLHHIYAQSVLGVSLENCLLIFSNLFAISLPNLANLSNNQAKESGTSKDGNAIGAYYIITFDKEKYSY